MRVLGDLRPASAFEPRSDPSLDSDAASSAASAGGSPSSDHVRPWPPEGLQRLNPGIIALIVVVGIFDLALTISAFENGSLIELNPIADSVLAYGGSPALAAYRFGMTTIACVTWSWALKAYGLRHRAGADARRIRAVITSAATLLVVAHVGLVGWWLAWLAA